MYNKATGTITDEEIYYFRERTRNRSYAAVASAFSRMVEKEGLTKRELAIRLGKEPAQITRWLSGPGNWTLDTISDLLRAMGAELEQSVSWIDEKTVTELQHELNNNQPDSKIVWMTDQRLWNTNVPDKEVNKMMNVGSGSNGSKAM